MIKIESAIGAVIVAAALCILPPGARANSGGSALPVPQGTASWYGFELHGRPTASGEPFDANGLTAAHPTLPFGTEVRVTNQANGKSVVVRINDRGPFAGERIIDLSRQAALEIGMLRSGVGRVRLELADRS